MGIPVDDSFVRGDLQRVTTGVIGERADAVVLAFAGTDPGILQTLLTDANAKRDANDIHVGFDEASVVAKENTLKAAQQAMRANKPLFIAGHSLGGALSALAARECLAVQAPRAIYTFGMPRVGGETFAKSYDESVLGPVTYRLVHGDDIVPRVPLSDWGYRHVGRLLQCITDGKFDPAAALSTLPSDDPTLAASLLPAINNYVANVFSLKILGRPGPMPGLLGKSFRFLAPPIRHQFAGLLHRRAEALSSHRAVASRAKMACAPRASRAKDFGMRARPNRGSTRIDTHHGCEIRGDAIMERDDSGHQCLSSLELASGEWLQFVEASYNCIDRAETFST